VTPEDPSSPKSDTLSSQAATASAPATPSFGISIPGYVLERHLGQGGMGAVYLARDESLGRRVALKVVLETRAGDEEARSRFRREARAMASVEHPNVVRLYTFGTTETSDYLVMEYVEGETLATRLSRGGPLAENEALRILREMLLGLEAAWEKGIVHRDVKPSNVLLDAKGRARVADFGLAKSAVRALDESWLTADQSVLGTPHYLSPEQARGQPVDFRSDVYSAGLVLYEMLTGERPFQGPTPAVVVARRLTEEAPDLATKCPGLSQRTLSVYRWMVNRLPEQRPASYEELIAATDSPTGREKLGSTGMRRWTVSLGASLILVAAGAAVLWLRPPQHSLAKPSVLVVAVAPFYGPDEDSAREGKVMAALVQGEVSRRLGTLGAKVIGPEETRTVVRDHAAARSLGERAEAAVVIWGEAFALNGESEIQPYFTLVPPKKEAPAQAGAGAGVRARDVLEGLGERAAGPVVLAAQATNQIGLRRTGAAGIGDLVLVLAGVQALYAEDRPERALSYFDQAPRSSESLRYRAEALERLGRFDDALATARQAAAADPLDASAQAQLGDCALRAGLFEEAVAAHRRAAEMRKPYTARRAIYQGGLLYVRETYHTLLYMQGKEQDTGYLLALDPESGRVLERHRCPGSILAMRPAGGGEGFEITYGTTVGDEEGRISFSQGRFDRPVFESPSLLLRRLGVNGGRAIAGNFWSWQKGFGPVYPTTDDAPRSLPELERALRAAQEHDPTQPWHAFFLGQAAWALGRREEAATVWDRMLAGPYPGTPYYEYAWMALLFEQTGQPAWADRAFEQGLARRRQLPQPIGFTLPVERMINAPFVRRDTMATSDQRAFVWWQRGRALTGFASEGEEAASALWSRYWRGRGDAAAAAAAEDFRDRAQVFSFTHALVDVDLASYAFTVAVLAFWITLIAFASRARPLRDRPIARLGPPSRRLILFAWLACLVSSLWLGESGRLLAGAYSFDRGHEDGTGSVFITSRLDALVTRHDVPETRWVAAVAHHLAGDRDRAAELYRTLRGDRRAEQNLEALERGNLVPPVALTGADLFEAYTAERWSGRLGWLAVPGRVFRVIEEPDFASPVAWLTALAGFVLAIALARIRPSSTTSVAVPGRKARLMLQLAPGLADLCRSHVWRGYATLVLFLFSALVAAMQVASLAGAPGLGPLSVFQGFDVFKAYVVPAAYSPAKDMATAAGRWWVLLSHEHASVFLGLAGTAALACLALHSRSLRRRTPAQHG